MLINYDDESHSFEHGNRLLIYTNLHAILAHRSPTFCYLLITFSTQSGKKKIAQQKLETLESMTFGVPSKTYNNRAITFYILMSSDECFIFCAFGYVNLIRKIV